MPDSIFSFESEPFELAIEGSEAEFRGRPVRRGPASTSPHRRPLRPLRQRWPVRRIVVPRIIQAAESRCPTAAVLEGYTPGSAALAPHHEDTLKRVVDFLQRSGPRVQSLQVIAWSNSAQPDENPSGISGQRIDTASARLQELLKAANRSVPIRGSIQRTRGPERVEIRLCL